MRLSDELIPQGRTPSFDARGNVRGFRSRPGAPPATPPQGLGPPPGAGSGTNAMSASSWVNTFRNTGPAMQRQAIAERLQMPGMSGTDIFRGISQQIVNEFMPQTPSAQSLNASSGSFNNPFSAPFSDPLRAFGLSTPTAAATPAPTVAQTPFTAPEPPPFDWTATIGNGTKSFSRTGTPQIQSRYGYAANVAPSFAWNRAFMNG